jgi:hypothetical protein
VSPSDVAKSLMMDCFTAASSATITPRDVP